MKTKIIFDNYEINEFGVIKNILTGKRLKGYLYRNQLRVCLNVNGMSKNIPINRILAESFVKKITTKDKVIPKDGNPYNTKIDNLLICSQRDVQFLRFKLNKKIGINFSNNKYHVRVFYNGKHIRIGSFEKIEDAQKAYKNKIKEINDNSVLVNKI